MSHLVGPSWINLKWLQIDKIYCNKATQVDTHQKQDKFNDMANLLDVVDKRERISSLQDDAISIIVVMSTTHTSKEIHVVWKGSDMNRFLMCYSMPSR